MLRLIFVKERWRSTNEKVTRKKEEKRKTDRHSLGATLAHFPYTTPRENIVRLTGENQNKTEQEGKSLQTPIRYPSEKPSYHQHTCNLFYQSYAQTSNRESPSIDMVVKIFHNFSPPTTASGMGLAEAQMQVRHRQTATGTNRAELHTAVLVTRKIIKSMIRWRHS